MQQIEVLRFLTNSYPSISLMTGDTFYWSPKDSTVYYKPDNDSDEAVWALLHESGHAILDHTKYYSDFELVAMEVDAWEKAKDLANEINELHEIKSSNKPTQNLHPAMTLINEDHIQDCLDTYRDWLYKRSLCPDCSLSGVQTDKNTYTCIFCNNKWQVSADRFCRPYRKKI